MWQFSFVIALEIGCRSEIIQSQTGHRFWDLAQRSRFLPLSLDSEPQSAPHLLTSWLKRKLVYATFLPVEMALHGTHLVNLWRPYRRPSFWVQGPGNIEGDFGDWCMNIGGEPQYSFTSPIKFPSTFPNTQKEGLLKGLHKICWLVPSYAKSLQRNQEDTAIEHLPIRLIEWNRPSGTFMKKQFPGIVSIG